MRRDGKGKKGLNAMGYVTLVITGKNGKVDYQEYNADMCMYPLKTACENAKKFCEDGTAIHAQVYDGNNVLRFEEFSWS